MNNYEFCAKWVIDRIESDNIQKNNNNITVLDYGCGAGQIVQQLRLNDINAFGCDFFYEGGDYSKSVDSSMFDRAIIKKMEDNTIPFDKASFDFVINNQVMEHVENLDNVLSEIDRVLKPGGIVLSLFPDKSVWREGHCGIPFLHWFPKESNLRLYYAAAWRTIGFGYHKENKAVMDWSRFWCEWIDHWTYYRPLLEINSAYDKYFYNISYLEDYWLQQRLGVENKATNYLPKIMQQLIVRKLGGLVFIAYKPLGD